ncbi:2-oxo acid dehydrogenase subunit E2, partial [Thermocatellispora tengchongensis]|uniref:2-oxo acid dehydrogenase subunit E2 n=1 Tax=Thermocatellispora tengchongensis TaxID=1073253 RepID=UPI0031E9CD28
PAGQAVAAQAGAALDGAGPGGAGPDGGPVVTEPARRLMEERGIPPERVRALGLRVVRRADVEGLDLIEVPRVQRRIAEVVTRSHREIPAAYAVMRIDVTGALSRARELSRSERTLIGVPELVIDAVAGLLGRFPLLFAAPVAGGRARPAEGAHVGVTIDVGRGMFIPVVRHADRLGPGGIARELTRFRATAMNGSFTEADLAGGAITLTLHPADGVIMAVPLVPPGQICALALTAPRSEVVEQAGGGFRARKVVSLGLAYDHRYVNGMQATAFLGEIRAGLERLSGGSAPI